MARSTLLFSFVMLLMHLVRKKKLQVVDRLNSVILTSSRRGRGRVTFMLLLVMVHYCPEVDGTAPCCTDLVVYCLLIAHRSPWSGDGLEVLWPLSWLVPRGMDETNPDRRRKSLGCCSSNHPDGACVITVFSAVPCVLHLLIARKDFFFRWLNLDMSRLLTRE